MRTSATEDRRTKLIAAYGRIAATLRKKGVVRVTRALTAMFRSDADFRSALWQAMMARGLRVAAHKVGAAGTYRVELKRAWDR